MAQHEMDDLVQRLQKMIIQEKLESGDRLASERDLAKQMQVGRPRIREALKTLESMGVLEIRRGSGAYIREPKVKIDSFPFVLMLNNDKSREEMVKELVQTRSMIECQILQMLIEKATDQQIQQLSDYLDWEREHMGEATAYQEMVETNLFERMMAEIVGNSMLQSLHSSICHMWQILIKQLGVEVGEIETINHQHRAILEAVHRRDVSEAIAAMKYHISLPLRYNAEKH
ncbi:MAG: FadR/GntR family transcriptional regulator [Eubacteriales bacterium]|jgi:GntR family transcriptional repressor for pyruvate dehydrogenase complex